MTSAKFSGFLTPPLVSILDQSIVLKSRNLPLLRQNLGTPLPPPLCWRHFWMAPILNALGSTTNEAGRAILDYCNNVFDHWKSHHLHTSYFLNNLSESSEAYIIVTEGDSCNIITSKVECERAAKQLNFPDPNGVHRASWLGLYAKGCICKEGGQDCLFNDQTTGLPCGTNEHYCICKDSPNETSQPTTAEGPWSVS